MESLPFCTRNSTSLPRWKLKGARKWKWGLEDGFQICLFGKLSESRTFAGRWNRNQKDLAGIDSSNHSNSQKKKEKNIVAKHSPSFESTDCKKYRQQYADEYVNLEIGWAIDISTGESEILGLKCDADSWKLAKTKMKNLCCGFVAKAESS